MRTRLALLLLAGLATPAFADKKLDPDPAFLAKARTAATAKVEPHYDLVSEKTPFWARFIACAGQLTAARDEGRALPIPRADVDNLIADYRKRARLNAGPTGRRRTRRRPPSTSMPRSQRCAPARCSCFPADTTKLGVEHMKKLHGQSPRLLPADTGLVRSAERRPHRKRPLWPSSRNWTKQHKERGCA